MTGEKYDIMIMSSECDSFLLMSFCTDVLMAPRGVSQY